MPASDTRVGQGTRPARMLLWPFRWSASSPSRGMRSHLRHGQVSALSSAPKAGRRASTQTLGVDYLPSASLPLAGSRSQHGGFFPQPPSTLSGLVVWKEQRVVSYKIRALSFTAAGRENGYSLSGEHSDLKSAWPLT